MVNMSRNQFWKRFWLYAITALVAIGLISYYVWTINYSQINSNPTSGQQYNPPTKGKTGGSSNKGGKSGSSGNSKTSGSPNNNGKSKSSGKGNSNPPKLVWGFDTTSKVNSSFYKCVTSNYGKPVFVARYLNSKQGVYTGLSKSETTFLHNKNVKILPIYDLQTKNATGTHQGKSSAQKAIKLAKNLGTSKDTYIIVDVEKGVSIDSKFLINWTTTLENAGYKAGLYGDFTNSTLKSAYEQSAKQSKQVKNGLMIWTNQPIVGIKGKGKAPTSFKGNSPNSSQTLVWQYGINTSSSNSKCNIDTDLGKGNVLKNLW